VHWNDRWNPVGEINHCLSIQYDFVSLFFFFTLISLLLLPAGHSLLLTFFIHNQRLPSALACLPFSLTHLFYPLLISLLLIVLSSYLLHPCYFFFISFLLYYCINKSINELINRSISINQPSNQLTNEPINQPINLSINQYKLEVALLQVEVELIISNHELKA